MITAEHLSNTHPRSDGTHVEALRDLSFKIEAGEFVTVRGASGSGKSSLLNIMGCLDRATQGVYRFLSNDVSFCSDGQLAKLRSRKIGFVFQSFNLLARTTAVENVEVPMIYLDGRLNRKRALDALERVGLRPRAHHFASELSGGEQQIAGAEVMRILGELHREGRTIVLVTHDDAIAAHAAREIKLRDGRLESDRSLEPAGKEDKR
jgi:putative ABC transport system ATP-binding protein